MWESLRSVIKLYGICFSLQGLSTAIVLCVLMMHGVSSRDAAIPTSMLMLIVIRSLVNSFNDLFLGTVCRNCAKSQRRQVKSIVCVAVRVLVMQSL